MNKRGQIYLLTALIMSVIIYGMVTVSNKVSQEELKSDFEKLSQNYVTESAKLINSLIGKNDVASAFQNFTIMFTSYAKAQNPRFELIYAFDYNDSLYIGNFLKNRIFVCLDQDCNTILEPLEGCYTNIPASISFDGLELQLEPEKVELNSDCEIKYDYSESVDGLFITINDVTYYFEIRKNRPELILVSWETKAEQRKVFTKGSFKEELTGAQPLITLSEYCQKTCDSSYCLADCTARCNLITDKDECLVNADCNWNTNLDNCMNK